LLAFAFVMAAKAQGHTNVSKGELVAYGIGPDIVPFALAELQQLGIFKIQRHGPRSTSFGLADGWRSITMDRARKIRDEVRAGSVTSIRQREHAMMRNEHEHLLKATSAAAMVDSAAFAALNAADVSIFAMLVEAVKRCRWLWDRRQPILGSIADTYVRDCREYHGPLPATVAFLPARGEDGPAMIDITWRDRYRYACRARYPSHKAEAGRLGQGGHGQRQDHDRHGFARLAGRACTAE
jgi:hypothetical protein